MTILSSACGTRAVVHGSCLAAVIMLWPSSGHALPTLVGGYAAQVDMAEGELSHLCCKGTSADPSYIHNGIMTENSFDKQTYGAVVIWPTSPSVTAHASTPPVTVASWAANGDPLGNQVTSTLSYFARATSLTSSSLLVPLEVAYNLQVDARSVEIFNGAGNPQSSRDSAYAQVSVSIPGSAVSWFDSIAGAGGAGHPGNFLPEYPPTTKAGTEQIRVLPNEGVQITVFASASSQDGGVAYANVDPYIYIDPDFLLAHPGYSIEISPGIANVPSSPVGIGDPTGIPEPCTWTILAGGLFGLGTLLRLRPT